MVHVGNVWDAPYMMNMKPIDNIFNEIFETNDLHLVWSTNDLRETIGTNEAQHDYIGHWDLPQQQKYNQKISSKPEWNVFF